VKEINDILKQFETEENEEEKKKVDKEEKVKTPINELKTPMSRA
jgi:hypothetical protein